MLRKLIEKQQLHLQTFFSQLDLVLCEKLFLQLFESKGTLFLTGVGKSGFIAQKIAATLASTGTKAFFLSPLDALHGDLGLISKGDTVIFLSKSGETDELLNLLPFTRQKKARSLAITSNSKSRLANNADSHIFLPCLGELCPFNLAPTSSTAIQLLFGDLMAMRLMELREFKLPQLAENHPGGLIGRRSTLRVKDLMLHDEGIPLVLSQTTLETVLNDFTNKRCGCLIVTDEEKKLMGIFTDGDLRRALQAKGEGVLKEALSDLMTPKPKAIRADDLAWDALQLMEANREQPVMVLPVVGKEDEVVGLIKMHDLIQAGL